MCAASRIRFALAQAPHVVCVCCEKPNEEGWIEVRDGSKVPMGTHFWQLVCHVSQHAPGLTTECELLLLLLLFGHAPEKCVQKVHTQRKSVAAQPNPVVNYRLHAHCL